MTTLALYIYPMPTGTAYGCKELSDPKNVIQLFDYAQILEAVISKQGWDFLIRQYGYQGLFLLNQESDWLDCSSVEEYSEQVQYEIEIAPVTLA